ncbi:unnamed protein product [Ilex paraguariensis]|uniref:protein-serine/threonine phosphatase n=1 Tax=Ilex paraguariensis TaxID=185542 RepID=A0ABC8T6G7_9AQUA
MTSNSGGPSGFLARKASEARRKRLDIERAKSFILMNRLEPLNDPKFGTDDDCSVKKRRIGFTEVTSSDPPNATGKDSKIDLGAGKLNNELPMSDSGESSSHSSESGGAPVEIVVREGEVCVGEESEPVGLTCLSYGSISMLGRRRAMEDAVTMERGMVAGKFMFFAVYDGHGGSSVANACRDRLHHLVTKEIEGRTSPEGRTPACGGGIEWEKVMKTCFAKMDEEVSERAGGGNEVEVRDGPSMSVTKLGSVGSTAVVVILGKEELVVANCGDSRAVLCRGGVAVPLTNDHKPDRPDEKERVEAAGGRVIEWNGSRVLGVLATSRSIGDYYLKPYVISEPEVTMSMRTELDDFLIIATDGLWDVVSNAVACKLVRKCFDGQYGMKSSDRNCATDAASMLAGLAMAKGAKDNISVIVVELKKSTCTGT